MHLIRIAFSYIALLAWFVVVAFPAGILQPIFYSHLFPKLVLYIVFAYSNRLSIFTLARLCI